MRIISGKFKGKKINLPRDKTTRPLRDLVKEALFNVITHSNKININLKNSVILDLFSGFWFIWFRGNIKRCKKVSVC